MVGLRRPRDASEEPGAGKTELDGGSQLRVGVLGIRAPLERLRRVRLRLCTAVATVQHGAPAVRLQLHDAPTTLIAVTSNVSWKTLVRKIGQTSEHIAPVINADRNHLLTLVLNLVQATVVAGSGGLARRLATPVGGKSTAARQSTAARPRSTNKSTTSHTIKTKSGGLILHAAAGTNTLRDELLEGSHLVASRIRLKLAERTELCPGSVVSKGAALEAFDHVDEGLGRRLADDNPVPRHNPQELLLAVDGEVLQQGDNGSALPKGRRLQVCGPSLVKLRQVRVQDTARPSTRCLGQRLRRQRP